MTARRLWIAAGALVAVVTVLSWWQRTADRAALVAEIEAAIAAKRVPPRPAPTPEELDTGELYARALALLVPADPRIHEEEERAGPSDPLPLATAFVAGNAGALALLDQAAARIGCGFPDDALLRVKQGPMALHGLLATRGRLEVRGGDLPAAVRTASMLRTAGRHLGSIAPLGFQPRRNLNDIFAEIRALVLLESIAVRPDLDAATAAAAAHALEGPWALETWILEALVDDDWFDRMCLWAMSPEAETWAADRNRVSGLDAMWDAVVRGRSATGRVRLPSVGNIRAMRTVADEVVNAARTRDLAAFRPGGPLDASFDRWKDEGLGLNALSAPSPTWFRMALRWEARLAVVRAALEVRTAQFREGRPPATIERLDPFDGKPLRYLVGPGDGWVVGSRCWKGIDTPDELRFPGTGK